MVPVFWGYLDILYNGNKVVYPRQNTGFTNQNGDTPSPCDWTILENLQWLLVLNLNWIDTVISWRLGVWPPKMNQQPESVGLNQPESVFSWLWQNRTRWYPASELVPYLPHKPSKTHQFASIFMFTKVGHYLFMAAWITTFGLPMACQCLHWRTYHYQFCLR